MKNVVRVLLFISLLVNHSVAGNLANIVGAGYLPAGTPINAAPGQVVTVFVTSLAAPAQPISATTVPLPYKLGGISALLLPGPVPVPIMAVSSIDPCAFNVPVPQLSCGTLVGVTVQIPFELIVDSGTEAPPTLSYLTISDDSGNSGSVRLFAGPDQIHVIGSQNRLLGGGIVTHADGTVIDYAHPAKPGEEVVMYAFGLGKTAPAVATGASSPSPAVSALGFRLTFDYRPNAMPAPGLGQNPPSPAQTPLFAGLTPGFVGLYQINFRIPSPPGPVLPCVGSVGSGANPFNAVLSNLTVTLVGFSSFDGASICVAAGS